MLDKVVEQMIQRVTAAYIPDVEEKANARKSELEEMKLKVRNNPAEVEEWFNREIEKLKSIDIKEIMKSATAGI